VCSDAEARRLHRIALKATTRAPDVVCGTLVVCVPVAACNIAHAAEIGKEWFEGGEMWQDIAALHIPVIILPCCYTQNSVVCAELSVWRLKHVLEIDLADDFRVLIVLCQMVDHADELNADDCSVN
jgi:hypothetical protein